MTKKILYQEKKKQNGKESFQDKDQIKGTVESRHRKSFSSKWTIQVSTLQFKATILLVHS